MQVHYADWLNPLGKIVGVVLELRYAEADRMRASCVRCHDMHSAYLVQLHLAGNAGARGSPR
jgi:hypothetical protein